MDLEHLPSNAAEVEADRSLAELTPKHTIFLSHSGAQKPFVERLCKDMEDVGHYPFFDQREDSLPKGKKFAELIFKAARKCRVAVVVLSKEFLSSKWPMQELAEFVNAMESDNQKLSLLPLFFELSVSELSNESISNTWMLKWTELGKKDPRVDEGCLQKWEKAVRKLRGVNGHVFARFGGSEEEYRKAVVKTIFQLVRPEVLYDTSDVQGCDRMCEILSERFVEHPPSSGKQPQMLGLYGMGGLGKSTMCKALCNHFQEEFCGRVRHVELGSEDPLILQKQVLKMLSVNDEMLRSITEPSQGRKVLKEQMRRYPVFLAIDNVGDSDECRTEARAFLGANFDPSSKVMVVSRSKHVVEALLDDPEYCKPLPDLMMEEAAATFLSKAAPKKKFSSLDLEERRILDVCLKECRFSPDGDPNVDVKKYGQYHPLALRALGVYFHVISSTNLSSWKRRLDEFDKLKRSRDCPRIFHILGSQFSTFEDETKELMFLDVALYARGYFGSFELKSYEQWVKWLAALHNENITVVEDTLDDLQRNAMINVGESAVTTHDLYKEYAEWYVSKNADRKQRWCVYQEHAENLPHELASSCDSGGCWKDLRRISIEGNLKRFSLKRVQEWRNIVVLQLSFCGEITELDLHGFSRLCHLELKGLTKLEKLIFPVDDEEDDCPSELQFVYFKKLNALKHLPSFSLCTSLRMFIMRDCPALTEPLTSLESCSHLDTFKMEWDAGRSCAPNLSSMTSLNNLSIVVDCFSPNLPPVIRINELAGLGNLINLWFLNLMHLPIERLPGLERLSNLRLINLEYCVHLTELPDLSGLAQVEMLNVSWTGVRELRGVDRMSKLRSLDCRYCTELRELPDLHCLSDLRTVTTRGCSRLSKHPKVPKHPCIHDKDKLVSAGSKKKSTTSAEEDLDPFDIFGSDFDQLCGN